jgi:lipopolysaccharide assembly outer membrane protein LptD (OstA)
MPAFLRTSILLVAFFAQTAYAQTTTDTPPKDDVRPRADIDRAAPLYVQGDQLIRDTPNNRIIFQGNVEIRYSNYILTADQVVHDQNINKLIAAGHAQLRDPTAPSPGLTGSR